MLYALMRRVAVLMCVVAALAACRVRTYYVPSLRTIETSNGEFLVEESEVRGIFGDVDVPSWVFEYRTRVQDRDELRRRLVAATGERGWQAAAPTKDGLLRFVAGPEGREMVIISEARVRFDKDSQVVRVAVVSVCTRRGPSTVAETHSGPGIETCVWSRLLR